MRFDSAFCFERMLLFDAQTSGGLLVAGAESLPVFERAMQTRGAAWTVGGVIAREQPASL